MSKLNKPLNLGLLMGSVAVSLALGFIGNIASDAAAALANMVSFLLLIVATVVLFRLWYVGWSSIQDGEVRTTPLKAVLFSVIPFFNIYWNFQMIWGFAKDFNGYIKQRDLSVPPLNEKLFLAQPILIGLALVLNFFLSVVLVLGVASDASEVLVGAVTVISGLMTIFIGLPLFFIMILIMNQLINGVNGLQEALSAESDSSA